MNKVVLMGRLTRNPDVRYSQGEKATCVARYTLAVNRRFRRDGEQDADFINCVIYFSYPCSLIYRQRAMKTIRR